MSFITVKRRTKNKKYYSKKMGMLNVPVTSIKKYILGIPFKTIHTYRETYYGTIKSCKACNIHA